MPFDTLSVHLRVVATKALAECKGRYGANGLKIEEGIDSSIGWRPTFYLKAQKFRIIAIEVEDNLYPEVLKGAAHDISHFDFPISVYQACSLEAYQTDPKHTKVNQLRKHGFGIITVDEDWNVTFQHLSIPLLQHISSDYFESELAELTPAVKVAFKTAYETYRTSEGQGLQQAGQIIEGILLSVADQAAKKGVISVAVAKGPLAEVIDELYNSKQFKDHRAALGGARDFVKEFRNTASHAPKNAKQAADKIRKCKTGFLDAVSVARKLRTVTKAMGYKTNIFVT